MLLEIGRVGDVPSQQHGSDEIFQDMPGGAGGLVGVAGVPVNRTLAPTGEAFRLDGYQDAFPHAGNPERGLERGDQRHGDVMEGERVEFHCCSFIRRSFFVRPGDLNLFQGGLGSFFRSRVLHRIERLLLQFFRVGV